MVHVDLNLLVALDALLEENSVQGAADRLQLSAPAVSRTLNRIRRATGDDILVRTGRTMTPTPYALQLRDETHALVQRARTLLSPARRLDLQTLTRVFTLRGHDALTTALAPLLTSSLSTAAPHAALRILSEAPGDSTDLIRGQVDLEVGAGRPSLPEIAFEEVGADRLEVVFRAGHPLLLTRLTPKTFAAAMHVTVSRRGRLRNAIDDALAAQGFERRVITALPTSSAALDLVARTDCLTVVAGRLCRPTWTARELETRPLPFDIPPVPVIIAWHRRYGTDPAHAWLRGMVHDALKSLLGDETGAESRR